MRGRGLMRAVCLAMLLLAALPALASAQAPPLATEFLLAETPAQQVDSEGTCNNPGQSTYTFEAAGVAGGVYVGTFTEQGSVTFAVPPGFGNAGVVSSFQSTFRIESGAYTITGTKTFTPESGATGTNNATCVAGELVFFTARVEYEATIVGPDGTDHQQGIALVNMTDAEVGSQSFPEGHGQFIEAFVTSSPSDTGPGPPATLTLEPAAATNVVGEEHCVTATVTDASGRPVPGVEVTFTVSGSNPRGPATRTTDANGQAVFCYTGELPGEDTISATVGGGPSDSATKLYVTPASTPGCKVTGGGRIVSAGDRATFSVQAQAPAKGEQVYQDHGRFTFKSTRTVAVVCSGDRATIFGEGEVDGATQVQYRIDLTDAGEPGRADTYRIRIVGGFAYDSGEQPLTGGNVQLH